jgi:phosphoglycerol transferase MdoB-like AlkP superfamily enzyme
MSETKTVVQSGGTSITGLLGVAFVVLKLTGYIDWSWWWVTLPFWGPAAILFAVLAVVLVAAGFALLIAWIAGMR